MKVITVVVEGLDTNAVSALVRELREAGYKVGLDFNFEFSTGGWDYEQQKQIPPRTVFTWMNQSGGTWFALKWS